MRALRELLERYLKSELSELIEQQIRLRHIGDDEGILASALEQLRTAERKTAQFGGLILNFALNYGGRQEFTRVANLLPADVINGAYESSQLSTEVFSHYLYDADLPDPDLVIRTGGKIQINNFLPWKIACAGLYFTETLRPDFVKADFIDALKEFQGRAFRSHNRTTERSAGVNSSKIGLKH